MSSQNTFGCFRFKFHHPLLTVTVTEGFVDTGVYEALFFFSFNSEVCFLNVTCGPCIPPAGLVTPVGGAVEEELGQWVKAEADEAR